MGTTPSQYFPDKTATTVLEPPSTPARRGAYWLPSLDAYM